MPTSTTFYSLAMRFRAGSRKSAGGENHCIITFPAAGCLLSMNCPRHQGDDHQEMLRDFCICSQIAEEYQQLRPVLLAALNGAFMFLSGTSPQLSVN